MDPQLTQRGLPSRVTLTNETSPGSITGNLTLTRDTTMCAVGTTAIVKVLDSTDFAQ